VYEAREEGREGGREGGRAYLEELLDIGQVVVLGHEGAGGSPLGREGGREARMRNVSCMCERA